MSRKLDYLGHLHYIIIYVIAPILMTAFASTYIVSRDPVPSFLAALYATHVFRMVCHQNHNFHHHHHHLAVKMKSFLQIWQRSKDALLCFAIFSILDISGSLNSWLILNASSPGLILILLDLLCDRFVRFSENVWLMITLTIINYTDKKLRRSCLDPTSYSLLNLIFLT